MRNCALVWLKYLLVVALGPLAQAQELKFSTEELLGKLEPSRHPDFVRVPDAFTNRSDAWLRKEVVDAFVRMAQAAERDGIQLKVISATRNFKRQREIWERKWDGLNGEDSTKAKNILMWSSMPGTSRHHWGTDFDLNSLEPSYFESGEGLRIYQWLCANAGTYGFIQPFSPIGDERLSGYQEERWHWSYRPLAEPYLQAYLWLIAYGDLKGFDGWESAEELSVFTHWVEGVKRNPGCQ